jgi:hypothetical protein
MLNTLIVDFASIYDYDIDFKLFLKKGKNVDYIDIWFCLHCDDIDFELFSKKWKLLTTLVVYFASTDDDIDFELLS